MGTFTTNSELKSNLQAIQGKGSVVNDFKGGWDKFRAGLAGVDKYGHQTGWGKFVDFMFTIDPLILGSFGGIRENTKQDVLRRKNDDVSAAIDNSDYQDYVRMKAQGRGQAIGGGLEVAANVVAGAALAGVGPLASAAGGAGGTAATVSSTATTTASGAPAVVAGSVGAGAQAGTTITLGAGTGIGAQTAAASANTASYMVAPAVSGTVQMVSPIGNTIVQGANAAPTISQLAQAGATSSLSSIGSEFQTIDDSVAGPIALQKYDDIPTGSSSDFAISTDSVTSAGTGGATASKVGTFESVVGGMFGLTDENGDITAKSGVDATTKYLEKVGVGTGKSSNEIQKARQKLYNSQNVVDARYADELEKNNEISGDLAWAQDIPFGIGHYFGGVQQAHTASANMESALDHYRARLNRSLDLASNEYAA